MQHLNIHQILTTINEGMNEPMNVEDLIDHVAGVSFCSRFREHMTKLLDQVSFVDIRKMIDEVCKIRDVEAMACVSHLCSFSNKTSFYRRASVYIKSHENTKSSALNQPESKEGVEPATAKVGNQAQRLEHKEHAKPLRELINIQPSADQTKENLLLLKKLLKIANKGKSKKMSMIALVVTAAGMHVFIEYKEHIKSLITNISDQDFRRFVRYITRRHQVTSDYVIDNLHQAAGAIIKQNDEDALVTLTLLKRISATGKESMTADDLIDVVESKKNFDQFKFQLNLLFKIASLNELFNVTNYLASKMGISRKQVAEKLDDLKKNCNDVFGERKKSRLKDFNDSSIESNDTVIEEADSEIDDIEDLEGVEHDIDTMTEEEIKERDRFASAHGLPLHAEIAASVEVFSGDVKYLSGDSARSYRQRMVDENPKRARRIANIRMVMYLDLLKIRMPNFKALVEDIRMSVELSMQSNAPLKLKNYLILGEPGIGKSHFVRELSKCLELGDPTLIDLSLTTASFVITGSSSSWHEAKPGRIYTALINNQFANSMIMVDEIDKVNSDRYNALNAFYSLLERDSARTFQDEFFGDALHFDASHLNYFATANDIADLPAAILSRMQVFKIDPPSHHERVSIAKLALKSVVEEHGWVAINTEIDDEVADKVASLCFDLREMKQLLIDSCGRAAMARRSQIMEDDVATLPMTSKHAIGFLRQA